MKSRPGWKSAVEIHPADWRFPAGESWIAGWIHPKTGEAVTDVRAWLDHVPFLGLHGLPQAIRPDSPAGTSAPVQRGFSFLLAPHRHASQLRLEACDLEGGWTEFFRTRVSVPKNSPPLPPPTSLAPLLPGLVALLLRRANRRPECSLSSLAREVVAAITAQPLNVSPSPPFFGALEEPDETGRVDHGRLSVTGWVAHAAANISRLTAIVDPLHEVPLRQGHPRPDIAGNFPELRHRKISAFVGEVDLPAGMSVPTLLKVFAEIDTGEKHLVFARRFSPAVPAGFAAPVPRISRLRFDRAVWALIAAARNQRLATTGVITAARRTWADYPARPTGKPALPQQSPGRRPPVRLLVATHNLNFEGAPRLVLELSSFLAREHGFQIQVISPTDGPMRQLFESAGMKVSVLDPAPLLGSESVTAFRAKLRDLGRSIDWAAVDLVLANTLASFWVVHLAHQAGKPALFYVHESAPVARFFTPQLRSALFPLVEEAFALARRVVFTADASRQIFAPLERQRNFLVLPSWLDAARIEAFVAQHGKATLRAKHGFAADSIVLLNLGTICERKGQHVFVQAAELLEAELRARYPGRRIEFVMVGAREDPFLQMLKARVAGMGLENVRFVPETRENYDFHRLADILVCTSFEESSPRVLLEAAVFGTSVVSTDVNGIPELLTGREAWLVEPGDHYRLAAALRHALTAHFAGDRSRAKRARLSVLRTYDESRSLPLHAALARGVAAR